MPEGCFAGHLRPHLREQPLEAVLQSKLNDARLCDGVDDLPEAGTDANTGNAKIGSIEGVEEF